MPYALIALLGIVSGAPFLYSGIPVYGDAWPHLARVLAVYQAFRAGVPADWSFLFYNGYPLLRFYSPLFYYLAGLLCYLTGGNAFSATKLLLFLCQVGSGFAFYALAQQVLSRSAPKGAAIVASAGYLFSSWHLTYVIGLGRFPAGLFMALMPLSLWLFDRMLESPGFRRTLLAGIALASLPLTHAFHALFWLPVMLLWLLLRSRRALIPAAICGIVAFTLSAFFVIPFLLEGLRYRMPSPVITIPAPSVSALLGFSQVLSGYSGTYLGLSIAAFALLGIGAYIYERNALTNPLLWGLLVALALTFNSAMPILNRVPVLGELSPERFLMFALLFLALLAGKGYCLIADRWFGSAPPTRWLWISALGLIFLDLSPKVMANVYHSRRRATANRDYIYEQLRGRNHGRFLDLSDEGTDMWRRYCRYPASGFLFAGLPSVLGPPYHQFAPKSMLYAYAWVNDIAQELADSTTTELSAAAQSELRLLGVRYLVALPAQVASSDSMTYLLLKQGITWDDSLVRAAQNTDSTGASERTLPLALGTFSASAPVVVSPRVQPWCYPAPDSQYTEVYSFYAARDARALIEAMKLNPHTGVAETIFTAFTIGRGREAVLLTRPLDEPTSITTALASMPSACSLAYDSVVHSTRSARLSLSVNSACYARLAFSYYPELRVTIDGRQTEVWETADHFLLIRLPEGKHEIVVYPASTRLRSITGIVSLVGLVLVLLALAGQRRRAKSGARG